MRSNVVWIVEFRWAGNPSPAVLDLLEWTPIFPTASGTRAEAREKMREEKGLYCYEWRYRIVKYTSDYPRPLPHN